MDRFAEILIKLANDKITDVEAQAIECITYTDNDLNLPCVLHE
jgi:hypothetical protein